MLDPTANHLSGSEHVPPTAGPRPPPTKSIQDKSPPSRPRYPGTQPPGATRRHGRPSVLRRSMPATYRETQRNPIHPAQAALRKPVRPRPPGRLPEQRPRRRPRRAPRTERDRRRRQHLGRNPAVPEHRPPPLQPQRRAPPPGPLNPGKVPGQPFEAAPTRHHSHRARRDRPSRHASRYSRC